MRTHQQTHYKYEGKYNYPERDIGEAYLYWIYI